MVPPAAVIDFLRNEDNFLILTHVDPDADGLGSAIALSLALQSLHKKTLLVEKNEVPYLYRFLPGHEKFFTFEQMQAEGITARQYKNLILVDCNHIDRAIDSQSNHWLKYNDSTVLVIDHHETTRQYGNIRWVNPDAPASGLMVYSIIRHLGITLTKEMAANLYAAIALDTGNFRFSNTTTEVLRTAADLIEAGAIPHRIYRDLYEAWSQERFSLFMRVLSTLEIRGNIAITTVTQKMFEETGSLPEDTENFVSFPRIMKDVKVSILLREVEADHFKISLRSQDNINVARIAEAFGGGGHINAAGCKIRSDADTVKASVVQKLRELYDL
jgi:phosphoesterase RecJ-like protein